MEIPLCAQLCDFQIRVTLRAKSEYLIFQRNLCTMEASVDRKEMRNSVAVKVQRPIHSFPPSTSSVSDFPLSELETIAFSYSNK